MRIAVIDFKAKGVARIIAKNVSELIRVEMINVGKYVVIEREQIDMIIKEQGVQQTGCTDVTCAVKIGKLLSARKILVGSVMKLGKRIIITGRIVDVENGIGEFSEKQDALSEDDLYRAVSLFTKKLSNKILNKDDDIGDYKIPVISRFQLLSKPVTSNRKIVFTLEGNDNKKITAWFINESGKTPNADGPQWIATGLFGSKPDSFILSAGYGTKKVYAWAKDAAGNVSNSVSITIMLTRTTGERNETLQDNKQISSNNTFNAEPEYKSPLFAGLSSLLPFWTGSWNKGFNYIGLGIFSTKIFCTYSILKYNARKQRAESEEYSIGTNNSEEIDNSKKEIVFYGKVLLLFTIGDIVYSVTSAILHNRKFELKSPESKNNDSTVFLAILPRYSLFDNKNYTKLLNGFDIAFMYRL